MKSFWSLKLASFLKGSGSRYVISALRFHPSWHHKFCFPSPQTWRMFRMGWTRFWRSNLILKHFCFQIIWRHFHYIGLFIPTRFMLWKIAGIERILNWKYELSQSTGALQIYTVETGTPVKKWTLYKYLPYTLQSRSVYIFLL